MRDIAAPAKALSSSIRMHQWRTHTQFQSYPIIQYFHFWLNVWMGFWYGTLARRRIRIKALHAYYYYCRRASGSFFALAKHLIRIRMAARSIPRKWSRWDIDDSFMCFEYMYIGANIIRKSFHNSISAAPWIFPCWFYCCVAIIV